MRFRSFYENLDEAYNGRKDRKFNKRYAAKNLADFKDEPLDINFDERILSLKRRVNQRFHEDILYVKDTNTVAANVTYYTFGNSIQLYYVYENPKFEGLLKRLCLNYYLKNHYGIISSTNQRPVEKKLWHELVPEALNQHKKIVTLNLNSGKPPTALVSMEEFHNFYNSGEDKKTSLRISND